MVDCRLCKNSEKIWSLLPDSDEYKLVCIAKELFIDPRCITDGPCEDYVDMDGYNPRE